MDGLKPDHSLNALVPELLVKNLDASLAFWCGPCGFTILYERRDEGFACLARDNAQVMLEEIARGRNWIDGPLEPPFGRGANFQITVTSISHIKDALAAIHWPLFMDSEEKWYRVSDYEIGVCQLLVQDPDGYLLRFGEPLGKRALIL